MNIMKKLGAVGTVVAVLGSVSVEAQDGTEKKEMTREEFHGGLDRLASDSRGEVYLNRKGRHQTEDLIRLLKKQAVDYQKGRQ